MPDADVPFTQTTPIRCASGLEARYIVAEAAGATQETVDFVNERRKVGDPAATDITLGDHTRCSGRRPWQGAAGLA